MEPRSSTIADPSRVAALAALHTADRQELTQLDLQLITIAGILSVYVGAVFTAWIPNAGSLPWGIYAAIPYPPLLIWSVFLSRLVLARVIIDMVTPTADRLALMAGLPEGSVSVPAHFPKDRSLAA
ncbi:hypothetical protein [Nocardia wallacei]|uniref:hypothetical protein n=1 Tax=Nocardia wallacei TaxID=480035 RepID=UPI0024576949|nr:hypothetical protein [Nocardia wallacei]